MERGHFSREVSKSLMIADSTLRKYCLALEEQGYTFDRGVNNARVFYQKDILVIQRLMNAMERGNTTIEQATKLVISSVQEDDVTVSVIPREQSLMDLQKGFNVLGQQLTSMFINELKACEQRISEKMDLLEKENKEIKSMLSERDRTIMQNIRAIQEQNKLLIEVAASKETKKWWQFWK